MSRIYVHGTGVVSPAGWGRDAFLNACQAGTALPAKPLARPGLDQPLITRAVPPANPRPAFLANPRLRRTSPITQYAMAAALEAVGNDAPLVADGSLRLGVVMCVMSGCVNYSRRFYDEALRDPSTASPLVFPETVFNAPASHVAAVLGTTAVNYTLVGDPATYAQGLALAADWLADDRVDGCLVLGAEELDWLTASAFHLFLPTMVLADGAGAIYLRREVPANGPAVEMTAVTAPHVYSALKNRTAAVQQTIHDLAALGPADLWCDGVQNVPRLDRAEQNLPAGRRLSVKTVLGDALPAAAAWQGIAAIEALRRGEAKNANVLLAGCNEQAVGVRFSQSA